MNFRRLNDKNLADFAANVATVLGGTGLPSVDSHVRTTLAAAFGTLPADLSTQSADAGVAEADRMSKVSLKNETRGALVELLSQVHASLRAARASEKEFTKCGFDVPKGPPTPYHPADPTDLVAVGTSNGVNTLKWKGNNISGSVVYEIWRLKGDTEPYRIIATTKKQSFLDTPVVPGEYYNYKVRAVAARAVSNYSNVAVVYGAV